MVVEADLSVDQFSIGGTPFQMSMLNPWCIRVDIIKTVFVIPVSLSLPTFVFTLTFRSGNK